MKKIDLLSFSLFLTIGDSAKKAEWYKMVAESKKATKSRKKILDPFAGYIKREG